MNKERQSIIIFKDKTFKVVNSKNSWEYENDLDWFATYEVSILLNSLLDVQLDFDTEYLEDEAQVLREEKKKEYPYVGSISISIVKDSKINVPDCMRVNIEVVDKWLVVGEITLEDFTKMLTGSQVDIAMINTGEN